jgi:hypothetical protein
MKIYMETVIFKWVLKKQDKVDQIQLAQDWDQ